MEFFIGVILVAIFSILMQVLATKSKVVKWIQPILYWLLSLNAVIFIIIFEMHEYVNYGKTFLQIIERNLENILYVFIIFNIPTIIMLIINRVMKNNRLSKKSTEIIGICSVIIIILAIVLFKVEMYLSYNAMSSTKINKESNQNLITNNISDTENTLKNEI